MDFLNYIAVGFWVLFFFYVFFKLYRSIRIVESQNVIIVERLGKYSRTLGAGFHLLVPFLERDAYYHTLKEQSIDVTPQVCITRDNVQVKVDGVLYVRVVEPKKASYGIADYQFAAIQLAQTMMRSIIGMMELDKTFEERDHINSKIVEAIDEASEHWGVKINRYEIINITPPQSVMDAMEKEKKAQITKKATISLSEGERDSKINRSMGLKEELINKSQGEKQKKINQAEGKAKEIESIAIATAKGIEAVAQALSQKGGNIAMELQIAEKFITELSKSSKKDTEVIMPMDMTNFSKILKNILGKES